MSPPRSCPKPLSSASQGHSDVDPLLVSSAQFSAYQNKQRDALPSVSSPGTPLHPGSDANFRMDHEPEPLMLKTKGSDGLVTLQPVRQLPLESADDKGRMDLESEMEEMRLRLDRALGELAAAQQQLAIERAGTEELGARLRDSAKAASLAAKLSSASESVVAESNRAKQGAESRLAQRDVELAASHTEVMALSARCEALAADAMSAVDSFEGEKGLRLQEAYDLRNELTQVGLWLLLHSSLSIHKPC